MSVHLVPYAPDRWTRRDAAHLLRRAQIGASGPEIERAAADGLEATLLRLTTPQPESDVFSATDAVLRRTAHDTREISDLKIWWLHRLLYSANPLLETMAVLWHNHFATSNAKVGSVDHMAAQNDLIRTQALGDFKQLLHGMARDVAMLIWLDGNANRKRHPNENFAREVMELFSLGVGNYSEDDIKEAARAFTGWHVREDKFWFNELQHDAGRKEIFGKRGKFRGDDVVDLCLAHPACPRFLAYKLLTAYVIPDPADDAIDELAGRILEYDYQLAPAVRDLLGSELFYGPEARAALIKSPLQFVLGSQRALEIRPNFQATARILAELGQDLFEPPTVKGWEGGRLWINSTSLLRRAAFAAELATGNRLGSLERLPQLVGRWGPTDNDVVRGAAGLLLARPPEPEMFAQLEGFLEKSGGDRPQQVRGLLHVIMTLPEYQLV